MVCGLWINILMGVYGDMPGAGLTALLQDRKEKLMSKEDDELINLSKYSTGSVDTITISEWEGFNGIKSSDVTVTVDGKLLKEVENDFLTTDAITLDSVTPGSHGDYSTMPLTINTDVRQGDLFNGWPEDGSPDPTTITVTLNEEK